MEYSIPVNEYVQYIYGIQFELVQQTQFEMSFEVELSKSFRTFEQFFSR